MTIPHDEPFDPVFNDIENETALPIGDGEFMRAGPISSRTPSSPKGVSRCRRAATSRGCSASSARTSWRWSASA